MWAQVLHDSYVKTEMMKMTADQYTYQSPSHLSHLSHCYRSQTNCCCWHLVVLPALPKHWHWLMMSWSPSAALFNHKSASIFTTK